MMTKWKVTHGTVVGFKMGNRNTYQREVEFQAPSGEKVVFTEDTGSGWRVPSIGREVKVRYSRDDPTQADIPTIAGCWFIPLVFLSAGAFCLFGSVMFYLVVP